MRLAGALLANWRREPDITLVYFQRGMQITRRARVRLLADNASVAEELASARGDQDDPGGTRTHSAAR
jgi:hypothetical protein